MDANVPIQPIQRLGVSRNLEVSMVLQQESSWANDYISSKIMLPLVCYVFQDGPWRDTLVRFGYDPRTDPNARLCVSSHSCPVLTQSRCSYQRLYFRNANHPIMRPSITTRRQDRTNVNLHIRNFEGGEDRK